MTGHVGECVYHCPLPRWMAELIRRQAAQEDVEAEGNDFLRGVPGRNEWEATSGAVKWWPRWGERGEASLFADFYFQWGEEEVQVCTDIFAPEANLEDPDCPWYGTPLEKRVVMARLAFWCLAARALTAELDTRYCPHTTNDLPTRQLIQGLAWVLAQVARAEADMRRELEVA